MALVINAPVWCSPQVTDSAKRRAGKITHRVVIATWSPRMCLVFFFIPRGLLKSLFIHAIATPESTISNSVARETESVELTFKYADLKGLDFLLGYRIDRLLKYDGIYESQNIQRIGAGGSRLMWIIKPANYDLPNSALYKDIALTIYRPVGMVPDTEDFQ